MRKIKGFSYDPKKDRDLIRHVDKQPNKSRYIWNLVKMDMERKNKRVEKLVVKYLKKYLEQRDGEYGEK